MIARNSSAADNGKALDIHQVGIELGVRYVLQGGVQKAGSRIRIVVQLFQAETRALVWADKYDGALEEVFELQDRITERVVGIVEPRLQQSEIERSRRKRTESLDAYGLYLRALPYVAAQMPREAKIALPLLQQSLKLDPDYPAAHALLAWCHELCFARAGFDEADRNAALRHANAAIASNTDDATTVAVAGFVLNFLGGEHETGLSVIDCALSLNPSCATALYLGAQAYAIADHGGTASALAERALQLSPFDPMAFEAHLALGEAALQDERYADADACFARAAQANPTFSTSYFFRALAQALARAPEKARPLIRRGLELEPGFRIRIFSELGTAPALLQRLTEGARLLGLPQ